MDGKRRRWVKDLVDEHGVLVWLVPTILAVAAAIELVVVLR